MAGEPSWSQISANTTVRRGMSCLHFKKMEKKMEREGEVENTG